MVSPKANNPDSPVAIITGGGTGVGAATALLLAKRGYHVAVNYSRSEKQAEETADACSQHGTKAIAIKADVASDSDCRRLVNEVVSRFAKVDVLVCSAGTTQFTSLANLENQNADDFAHVYGVNVIGPYQMARAAAPYLGKSKKGAIVNVSSIAGVNGNGSSLAYIASKGALNSLTLALARLLAPSVRVNAVLPGLIDTEWFLDGVSEEQYSIIRSNFAAASALEDVCTAGDIADAIIFLACDALKITGQLITVDAGYMLGRAVKVSK